MRVQAQTEIASLRQRILAHSAADHDLDHLERSVHGLAEQIHLGLQSRLAPLRRVINATGILVHTNLGRSPLPRQLMDELIPLLTDYCDLEVDLESGKRGERNRRVGPLIHALCGAEAALVTNNNAAALVLALSALAKDREVIVSRGELVEIGGSFRIPDILETSGARLKEVGTTNRTHLRDYQRAISDQTAIILKVHTSNYRVRGFTHGVSARQLAPLAKEHNLTLLMDEGSGLLRNHPHRQLQDHDSMAGLIADGCDLVCGSGDKLLGGPQAGLLIGRADLVETCRRFPLYRALRPNRFTYAALDAVLRRHLAGRTMPLDRLWPDPQDLEARLQRFIAPLPGDQIPSCRIVDADGYIGGGSAPDAHVPGRALAIDPADDQLARRLRLGAPDRDLPAVVGYLQEGRLIIDLRTVAPEDDSLVRKALVHALGAGS